MRVSMGRNAVAGIVLLLDQILIARVGTRDKERRLDAVLVEDAEELIGVGGGAVVEGQVDDLAVVLDFAVDDLVLDAALFIGAVFLEVDCAILDVPVA